METESKYFNTSKLGSRLIFINLLERDPLRLGNLDILSLRLIEASKIPRCQYQDSTRLENFIVVETGFIKTERFQICVGHDLLLLWSKGPSLVNTG